MVRPHHAQDLAERAAETYRILKCQLVADDMRESDCVPILEIHRGKDVALAVLDVDRQVKNLPETLGDAIRQLSQKDGESITACVFSVEVYTSYNMFTRSAFAPGTTELNPDVSEGLLTVAVTSDGDVGVKLMTYYYLDDGGIQFEEAKVRWEKVKELTVQMKGLWQRENNGKKG